VAVFDTVFVLGRHGVDYFCVIEMITHDQKMIKNNNKLIAGQCYEVRPTAVQGGWLGLTLLPAAHVWVSSRATRAIQCRT
jgi:hypothetical protein